MFPLSFSVSLRISTYPRGVRGRCFLVLSRVHVGWRDRGLHRALFMCRMGDYFWIRELRGADFACAGTTPPSLFAAHVCGLLTND